MWDRFTQRAQQAVAFAQEEADSQGERYVSTEHLLLGLLREGDTDAAHVLRTLEIEPQVLRAEIERQVTRGGQRAPGDMTLTPRGKRVIDLAYNEARQFGHNYIGTEHLLLGVIRERDGLAGRVLAKLGADLEKARDAVEALTSEERPAEDALASKTLSRRLRAMQVGKHEREKPVSLHFPPSTQQLLAQLDRIQSRRLSGIPPVFLTSLGSLFALLGLMCLYMFLTKPDGTGAMGAILMFFLTYALLASIVPKSEKEVVRQLAQVEDKRIVGALIQVMVWPDGKLRAEIMEALARLLPQLTVNDAPLLDANLRAHLYTTLTKRNIHQHTTYVLGVIKALEQVGDDKTILPMMRLAEGVARTEAEQQVKAAASVCLSYLEARDNRHRDSRTLLRPASASETPSDVLLRPAMGTAQSNPEELLRPTATEAKPKAQDT